MKNYYSGLQVTDGPLAPFSRAPLPILARALGIRPEIKLHTPCTVEDDRTEEQKKTHRWAIVARDSAMSGWGGARGGTSRCAWACAPEVNTDRVFNWVSQRSDMKRVALVDLNTYRAPKGTAHFHIYVCGVDHVGAKY